MQHWKQPPPLPPPPPPRIGRKTKNFLAAKSGLPTPLDTRLGTEALNPLPLDHIVLNPRCHAFTGHLQPLKLRSLNPQQRRCSDTHLGLPQVLIAQHMQQRKQPPLPEAIAPIHQLVSAPIKPSFHPALAMYCPMQQQRYIQYIWSPCQQQRSHPAVCVTTVGLIARLST